MLPDTQSLVLALIGTLLGGGTLGTLLTLFFSRRRTAAEAGKYDAEAVAKRAEARRTSAEAHRTDAEAQRTEADTVIKLYSDIRAALVQIGDCTKERAEALAENAQLKRTIEVLRQENVDKDKTITELHGRVGNG